MTFVKASESTPRAPHHAMRAMAPGSKISHDQWGFINNARPRGVVDRATEPRPRYKLFHR
eukprot:11154896-Lingulodinium_polyedra.AAC.1